MQLIEAGEILNVELMDHVIIGGQAHVSLKDQGLAFDPATLQPNAAQGPFDIGRRAPR